jgi:hypothetical protein
MGASTGTALAALKIGGRVAFERLARPKARRLDDVPCSPYAITPEWLTAVLCGKNPGAVVTHVEVKPASAGTHERHQLIVSYNEEGRPASTAQHVWKAISIRSFDLSSRSRRRFVIIPPTIGERLRPSICWKIWSQPNPRRFATIRLASRAQWPTT